jgi:hypothetical protein
MPHIRESSSARKLRSHSSWLPTLALLISASLAAPATAQPCRNGVYSALFGDNVTIYVPGLGRNVTAPIGVRIAPIPPVTPDYIYEMRLGSPPPRAWSYGWIWLNAAWPTEDIMTVFRDGYVAVVSGSRFFRGCEWLGRVLNGTKLIYKFDGYRLMTTRQNALAEDVFADYLMSRDSARYMYIEFYDLARNDGHTYQINVQNNQFTTGAMIIPMVPPTPEVLAYRREIRDRQTAVPDRILSNLIQGLFVTVLAAGAYAASTETIGERISREREECRRLNADLLSQGSMC